MPLGADTISCGDEPANSHAAIATTVDSFNFTAAGNKSVVVRIDKTVVQQTPNNGVSFYQVCYESDTVFTGRNGQDVQPGTSGLLPDCKTISDISRRASCRSRRTRRATSSRR